MPYKDRARQLEAQRQHYRDHTNDYHNRVKARRRERHAQVLDIKVKRGCENCGENHPAVLDFHHRDEDFKEHKICDMVHRGFTLAKILAEIAKCDVLCANCHRRFHYENG